MDTLFANRHISRLIAVFLAVVSLFFIAKLFSEFKNYNYIGKQYGAQNTISVTGHGEAFAVPDVAEVTFDVSQISKTVPEAQKKVTETMNGIIASLKKSGVAEKDIKTAYYSIYPQYEYQGQAVTCPQESYCPQSVPGKQVLTGYEVRHSITLKVRKTDQAGAILSSLGTMGVSNLSGINFTVDNEEAVKDEARSKAIVDAKDKAETLARQLGVKIVSVVNFSESGNYPIYYGKALLAVDGRGGGEVAPTPDIPTGENKITSDVSITYEIR